MVSHVRIGVVAFGGLILLFAILALSGPAWVESRGGEAGLWETCAGGSCSTYHTGGKCEAAGLDCDDRNDCSQCNDLNAARAFAVFTFLGALVAQSLLVVFSFFKDNPKMLTISAVTWGVTCFCAMISFACGTEAFKDAADAPGSRYGWAFGLMVTTWLFSAIICAVMFLVPDAGTKPAAA